MTEAPALPEVGSKHQHRKYGQVIVSEVKKLGRGWQVWHRGKDGAGFDVVGCDRLKDWTRATKA